MKRLVNRFSIVFWFVLTVGCSFDEDVGPNRTANVDSGQLASDADDPEQALDDTVDDEAGGASERDPGNSNSSSTDAANPEPNGDADIGSETSPDVPPTLSPNEYMTRFDRLFAEWRCEWIFSCSDKERPHAAIPYQYKSTCVTELPEETAQPRNRHIDYSVSVQSGRANFDPQKATTCLSELRTMLEANPCAYGGRTVGLISDFPTVCENVWQGTLEEDEACLPERDECNGPYADCERSETPDDACFGRCKSPLSGKTLLGEGATCGTSESTRCNWRDGLVCSYEDNGTEGVCVPWASQKKGDFCYWDNICERGLVCDGDAHKCVDFQFVAKGELCDKESRYCRPGYVCRKTATGGDTRRCAEFLKMGDSCHRSGACDYGLYCAGHTNRRPGTCRPYKARGASCNANDRSCDSALTCAKNRGGPHTCQPAYPSSCTLPE